ncbi:MAG: hypothetical protein WD230_06295, partial [Cucumibacter sp.]
TGALRVIHYHDGRPDVTEPIEVEPYPVQIKVPFGVALVWADAELAAHGLFAVEDFVPPEGKRRTGAASYRRDRGRVIEEYQVEDIPPPPPEPSDAEKFERLAAEFGLTGDKLAAEIAARVPKAAGRA